MPTNLSNDPPAPSGAIQTAGINYVVDGLVPINRLCDDYKLKREELELRLESEVVGEFS